MECEEDHKFVDGDRRRRLREQPRVEAPGRGGVGAEVDLLAAERHPHRIREDFDAAQHFLARFNVELYFFCSHVRCSFLLS